jgi:hypothetical protein
VLAGIKRAATRATIAEQSGIDVRHFPKLIGQNNPQRRAAWEARKGTVSLLTLKFVEVEHIASSEDGVNEWGCEITQAGRDALTVALTNAAGRVAADRVDEIPKQLKEKEREEVRLEKEQDRLWIAQHEERLRQL